MVHVTRIVRGGQSSTYPHVGCVDVFCSCGEFWINCQGASAHILAESHERVANAHDARLEREGACIHGGVTGR